MNTINTLNLVQTPIRFLALTALLLVGTSAMADGPSYNYIEARYMEADIDLGGDLDADGDGFGVAGSVGLGDSWFLFADYASFDLESVIDLTTTSAGVGFHSDISPSTDWFATISYEAADASASGFGSVDESGYGASVGVRGMVSKSLELYGSVGYTDLGDGADGTTYGAGLWYTVGGNFALGLGANFDDDVTIYGAGVRLYFD